MKELQHSITPWELKMLLVYDSRLALLILPLFDPVRPEPSPDFPVEFTQEFSHAFERILLLEGNKAIRFMMQLPDTRKETVFQILIQGGLGGSSYQAGEVAFSIPESPKKKKIASPPYRIIDRYE